jgi:hypothetical protein
VDHKHVHPRAAACCMVKAYQLQGQHDAAGTCREGSLHGANVVNYTLYYLPPEIIAPLGWYMQPGLSKSLEIYSFKLKVRKIKRDQISRGLFPG